jgi:hypothetical protein
MNVAQDNAALDSTVTAVFFLKRDSHCCRKFCLVGGQNFPMIDLTKTKREAVGVLGEE